jgi:hypothetical protein
MGKRKQYCSHCDCIQQGKFYNCTNGGIASCDICKGSDPIKYGNQRGQICQIKYKELNMIVEGNYENKETKLLFPSSSTMTETFFDSMVRFTKRFLFNNF